MNNKYRGGALKDNRVELVYKPRFSGLIDWSTTPTIPGILPSQRNQRGSPDSSSCVAQSKASCINSVTGIVASAQPIFIRRKGGLNSEGMYLSDADSIAFTVGTNTEALNPSQHLSDAKLDVPNTIPITIKATGDGIDVPITADDVAQAILEGKAVSAAFESNESEWDCPNNTPVYNGTPTSFGHCISLYGFVLINGVKTFIANDSDGQWSSPTGLRYITEDFLLKRCTGVSYNPNFVVITPTKPILAGYNITQTLTLGCIGYQVYMLQNRLVQDGFASFMPTGFFGFKTLTALEAYQQAHGLPVTGITDSATLAYMQQNG